MISDELRKMGAVSPFTSLTTAQVRQRIKDQDRIVYRELSRDPLVQRIDVEVSEAEDPSGVANGWYTGE